MSVGAGIPRLARYATFHEDSRGVHVWLEVNDQNPRWSIMWNLAGSTELVAYSPAGQSCALSVGSSVRGYEMHARLIEARQSHFWAIRAPHEDPLRTTVTTLSSALSPTEALLWLGHGDGFVYTGTRIVPLEKGPSDPAPVKDAFSAGVMVAIDGGVLAIDSAEGAPHDLSFYPISGAPPTLVLPVSDKRQVEYLGVDSTTGELIRIESEGESFETVRVYASPVVKASAKLVSRFVTRIPRTDLSKPSVALNAGYLFVGANAETSTGRVIRVSDGSYWQVTFTGTPVFVNEDYVWTMTNSAYPQRSALQRRPFPKGIPLPSEL